MADQDFNFPPAERREPKQFEPPPWERDAFDDLARAKAAEEAAAAEAARAAEEAAAAEAVRAAEAQAAAQSAAATEAGAVAAAGSATPAPADADAEDERPKVDEAQVTEMMAGLRAEEPTSMQTYGAIAIALSVFTGLVGVVMLIWAMAMFVSASARGTGRVGVVSGTIVAIFGALFIGLSMWVAVRTLRQRGVL